MQGGGKQLQTAMFCFMSPGQACADSQSIVAFLSSDGGAKNAFSAPFYTQNDHFNRES